VKRAAVWIAACALLGGCALRPEALDPAGVDAARIDRLWWLFFAVTAAVYIVVIVVAAVGVVRFRARGADTAGAVDAAPRSDRIAKPVVILALFVSFALLVVLGAADFRTRHAIRETEGPLVVQVTGHQWWWEFEYPDSAVPARTVTSPNELHLPVGTDVRLDLVSHDVIHSLWIPQLHGKMDLVPGHPTRMRIRVTRAGRYFGQCAEFCGHQHATMRLLVVAESPARFQQWMDAQRQVPAPPTTASAIHGHDVFMSSTCVMCHTIRGTSAASRVGPDLTHVGSRVSIAAVSLPNVKQHLMQWIANPQQSRPGVEMPPNPLPEHDLSALADYLEGLR